MSLPNDSLSLDAPPAPILAPDDQGRYIATEDYELGGIGLSDPSQGLQVQTWRARLVGQDVRVGAEPYSSEVTLLTGTNITELSLAFDQNMRPLVAFIDSGQAKLYWYDAVLGSNTIAVLDPGITSMFVTMDDKRPEPTLLNTNDVLLVYNRGGILYYRQQRERFQTERALALLQSATGRLRKLGMNNGWRVQIQVVY